MQCHVRNASFAYDAPYSELFRDLTLSLDTSWALALVGANGRGKTTLLQLLAGAKSLDSGTIACADRPILLPQRVPDMHRSVVDVQLSVVGADHESDVRIRIAENSAWLGIPTSMFDRPFHSLSGGERTRALLAAITAPDHVWPLLDEPTNHLDAAGCDVVISYLRDRARGFVLVSHHEAVLAGTCDHVLSIERDGVRLSSAPYAVWKAEREAQHERERRAEQHLERDIARLRAAAQERRQWSATTEREKNSAFDSGFVSRKAAKMMKRALHVERRQAAQIEAKEQLLQRFDVESSVRLPASLPSPSVVLQVDGLSIAYGSTMVVQNLSFTPRSGEIVAVCGPNGSGKSSIIRAIEGTIPYHGNISKPARLSMIVSHQEPAWQQGSLREHVTEAGIDETRYRTVLAALGVRGNVFERPLETFSFAQWKKIDLARSFVESCHLLVWDEPLNGLDPHSRAQILQAIKDAKPTMLIIDHDPAVLRELPVTFRVDSTRLQL